MLGFTLNLWPLHMYPWRIIRRFCLLLLVIPLIHLGYLAYTDPSGIINLAPESLQLELNRHSGQ